MFPQPEYLRNTTVTSNVVIDLSDDVEIRKVTSTRVKSEHASSVKSDIFYVAMAGRFNFLTPPHSPRWTMDKLVTRKKDAKAHPAPDTVLDADLPPLQYTSLALFHTWAQILFGVSQVTGPHCWFCCALGCILGVTVFSPCVKTIVEDCIDRILLGF